MDTTKDGVKIMTNSFFSRMLTVLSMLPRAELQQLISAFDVAESFNEVESRKFGINLHYAADQPNPLLADAQVGDLCRLRNGEYVQIERIFDKANFPIYTGSGMYPLDGMLWHGLEQARDIVSVERLAEVGSAEWGLQRIKLGDIVCCDNGFYHKLENALINIYCIRDGSQIGEFYVDKWLTNYRHLSGWRIYEPPVKEPTQFIKDWEANLERIHGKPEPESVIDCKNCAGYIGCRLASDTGVVSCIDHKPIKPEPAKEPVAKKRHKEYRVTCERCSGKGNFDTQRRGNVQCMECDGRGYVYKEELPSPQFAVGDWVLCEKWDGTIIQDMVRLVGKGWSGFATQDVSGTGRYCYNLDGTPAYDSSEYKKILRKLKASEVVLDFGNGILARIVAQAVNPFWINLIVDGAIIGSLFIAAIKDPLRNTVERLLEAISKEAKNEKALD